MHGGASVVLGLAFPLLDALLLHGEGSVHVVQLEVQTAGVAYRIAFVVAPPERRGVGLAIGAGHPVAAIIGSDCLLRLGLPLGYPRREPHEVRAAGAEVVAALPHVRRVAVLALELVVRRSSGRSRHQTGIVLANAAGGRPVGGGHVPGRVLINNLWMEIGLRMERIC